MIPWTRKELAWLIVALCLLPVISLVQSGLGGMPEQVELRESEPFEKLPPTDYLMEYVGSIMLGGFRALAVDVLWLRADRLQREYRWDELRAVFEAIGRLQPRMPEVCAHNAWNMAYNISNQFDTPEDKIKWIRAGLEYLERGRLLMPKEDRLPFWIGFMYWHRIPRDEHTNAPLVDRQVLELIEAEEGRCTYSRAIPYLQEAQRLFNEQALNEADLVDKHEGLIVDSLFHEAWHMLGYCWARPGIASEPTRWGRVRDKLEETARYARYIDNRYYPGTSFWDERIQWIRRLEGILETDRDMERRLLAGGLEAAIPAAWQVVSDLKALKAAKSLFRQGALERRLRGALFLVCRAAYARLDAGNVAGAADLWRQAIQSSQTGHRTDDPYQLSWFAWGEGMKTLLDGFEEEAAAMRAAREGRPDEARERAAHAVRGYEKVLEENGLMEIPLIVDRAETLKRLRDGK